MLQKKAALFDDYLSGHKLFGDDFSADEIRAWFDDEKDAYFNFKGREHYSYDYHVFNIFHAYKFLKNKRFKNVLGIGSAFGYEFIPILDRIEKLTILESSVGFFAEEIKGKGINYVQSSPSNPLPFENESFDLIVCLGILHHIPNVTYVLRDSYRCLRSGGFLILREPVVSMGDWRLNRKGLTKRERGIPQHILRNILDNIGYTVLKQRNCAFPLIRHIGDFFHIQVYNSYFFVILDFIFSNLFSFNRIYHPRYIWEKIRPISVFYLLTRY